MGRATGAVLQRRRLRIEVLETRALLSGVSYTLTTDQSTYQVGQPIQITLTGTNNTDQAIETISGPDADDFFVSENGVPIWNSEPVSLNLATLTTLQPGQSFTETATWDGVPNLEQAPILAGGSFTVTNPAVTGSLSASFTIDTPLSYSLTTDQSSYSIGQPIQIFYTETNTTSQPLTVSTAPSDFAVTQDGYGTLFANVAGSWGVASDTETTLQPGQSISETATWDGVANVGSAAGANVWYGLSISNPSAPAGVTATVNIADPLVTSLSATSPSFAAGQPVTLTYTATNSSDVPVTVLDSPGSFSIQAELPLLYTTVFSQPGSSGGPLVTLQPGQSLTQTASWTPAAGQVAVGTYSAYFSGLWMGTGTTFVVGTPGSVVATFATDQTDYAVGQPIQITLTETNTSNAPVTVNTGPSEFQITGGYFLVADVSGSGGTQSTTETLQPGQSFIQTATWNGVTNIGTTAGTSPTGSFFVQSENAPLFAGAAFEITPDNPPVNLPHLPSPPLSGVAASLTTAGPTVRPGQPMALTLTLTNQSKKQLKVTPASSPDELMIYRGSQLVWQSRKLTLKGKKTITAGKSIKLRGSFNAKTPRLTSARLAPGSYTLEVSYDGYTASKTIQFKG
jgi:hypothetical protein